MNEKKREDKKQVVFNNYFTYAFTGKIGMIKLGTGQTSQYSEI